MHVITFYSFKGGTGRSMALINVAVEFVKSGRKVLIVDFDLEAPGLDTFNMPQPKEPTKGLVEYVLEYINKDSAPDASEFIYRSPILPGTGELWIMPAGLPDADYDDRYKSIDWKDLYDNRDGYLFFEDLKNQWDNLLKPDYVLIDSRTGHTDVGGICTRQLPDSVAFFFFPNEQNRRGLEGVVKQIREETKRTRERPIEIHFVMSNIPELDDEEGLLEQSVARFKHTLSFREFSGIIHQYQSLSLVTQSVFTLERPKTRLAQEYQKLAKALRRGNLADPLAALEFIEDVARSFRNISPLELEQRLQDIRQHHASNLDVLLKLAVLLRRQRRYAEALAILDEAGELGAKSSEFLLARAELRLNADDPRAALEDMRLLLETADATYVEIGAVIRLLRQLNEPRELERIRTSIPFQKLTADGKRYVANELFCSRDAVFYARGILQELLEQSTLSAEEHDQIRRDLVVALIATGRFETAISLLIGGHGSQTELGFSDAVHYGMSDWGIHNRANPELFQRAINLRKDEHQTMTDYQALTLSLWAIGKKRQALTTLSQAQQNAMTRPQPSLSVWSYLRLTAREFSRDLDEMKSAINSDEVLPRLFQETRELRTMDRDR